MGEGSTIIHVPSSASARRTWPAAPAGSDMSLTQSSTSPGRTRSPGKSWAAATSNRTRSPSPASAARLRDASIEGGEVEADDVGCRVGGGHDQRRRAEAASDIGDPPTGGQLGLNTVEGGQPGAGQVADVARFEEALRTYGEQIGCWCSPRGPSPVRNRSSIFSSSLMVDMARRMPPGMEGRAVLVGQAEGLLRGQGEAPEAGS